MTIAVRPPSVVGHLSERLLHHQLPTPSDRPELWTAGPRCGGNVRLQPPASGDEPDGEPTVQRAAMTTVVTLSGAIDGRTLRAMEGLIEHIACAGDDHLTLDASSVECIDDAGVRMVVALDSYMRARGGGLTVAGARPAVAAALGHTHVLVQATCPVAATAEPALGGARRRPTSADPGGRPTTTAGSSTSAN